MNKTKQNKKYTQCFAILFNRSYIDLIDLIDLNREERK